MPSYGQGVWGLDAGGQFSHSSPKHTSQRFPQDSDSCSLQDPVWLLSVLMGPPSLLKHPGHVSPLLWVPPDRSAPQIPEVLEANWISPGSFCSKKGPSEDVQPPKVALSCRGFWAGGGA